MFGNSARWGGGSHYKTVHAFVLFLIFLDIHVQVLNVRNETNWHMYVITAKTVSMIRRLSKRI